MTPKEYVDAFWNTATRKQLEDLFYKAQHEALLKAWEWFAKDSFTNPEDGDAIIVLDNDYEKILFLKELTQ